MSLLRRYTRGMPNNERNILVNLLPSPRRFPLPEVLMVLGFSDRAVEAHGHRPTDEYPERCWLPVIGPSAYLLWRALNRLIPAVGSGAVEVDALDVMGGLGLGARVGANAPGARALNRLVMFGFAYRTGTDGCVVSVRRAIGPVPERALERLSTSARIYHEAHGRW